VTAHPFLRVPYHIDEYLPDLDLPLPAGRVITAELQAGDVWGRLAGLYAAVASAVAATALDGGCPVAVSGDCTTALGTMAGLQQAGVDPAIVWIDAHGDLQTLETTTSGYLGGLPLRLLAGYRPELIADRLGLQPVPGGGSCWRAPATSIRPRPSTWPAR
jgi:arginase